MDVESSGTNQIGKGYYYFPKTLSDIPIEPIKLDPASFDSKGIITKYGQKLLKEGSKYYEKIGIY